VSAGNYAAAASQKGSVNFQQRQSVRNEEWRDEVLSKVLTGIVYLFKGECFLQFEIF